MKTKTTPDAPNATWILIFICTLCFVNMFDRNIIAGAPAQFQYFIQMSTKTTEEGALLGLLSSSFIASYAICTPLFGYLSLYVKPFRLVAIGLLIWSFAVFLCCMSKSQNSFELLFVGRLLSGIGEASFACIALPFIHKNAPSAYQTIWMSGYYVSALLGSIFGAIGASTFSTTSFGWDGLYAVEGVVVLLASAICAFCIPDKFNQVAKNNSMDENSSLLPTEEYAEPKNFFAEAWHVCTNTIFVLISFGSAATSFTTGCLSLVLTLVVLGLGAFSSETDVNVSMGGLTVLTSIAGSFIGGIILDWSSRDNHDYQMYNALRQLVISLPLAVLALFAGLYALPNRTGFLFFMGLESLINSTLSPVLTTALLDSVEISRRAMAIGIMGIITQAFGSVPAPYVMGRIKDSWAPHCNSILIDGIIQLNPRCIEDKEGLLDSLIFAMVWLIGAAGLFFCAFYIERRRMMKGKNQA